MKINIISFNNALSLTEDIEMFSSVIKKLYKNTDIKYAYYNFQETTCHLADINIFIGVISNFFFKYAPVNMYICDHHKLHNSWLGYLNKTDYILTKTESSKEIIKNIIPSGNIINIGWKTNDRFNNSIEKDYDSFLYVLGQSTYRQLNIILDIWKDSYPKLTILCGKNYLKNNNISKKEQENIVYIEKHISDNELTKLLINNGFHFCLSSATTISNGLHNCLSSKSIPIYINSIPYNKLISNNINGYSVKVSKKKKLKNNPGSQYILDKDDLINIIENIINNKDEIKWEDMGEDNKKLIRNNEREFERNLKIILDEIRKKYLKSEKINPRYEIFNEDLPNVSIITPTYNREKFIKLMIRNYQKIDYPQEKFEWIIIDDSDNCNIKELLPKNNNIKYITTTKKTIGEKRNIGVENSKNDIIICMDDDDYYPPSSIKYRVGCLEYLKKNIIGCCSLGLLEINKIISNLNVASFTEKLSKRIFESTLCFRKSWWENHKFSNTNINECIGLFDDKNIIENFEEIQYQNVIVSLIHNNNTNNRITINGETNGCHFNFSDELFTLITSIDFDNDKTEFNKKIPKSTDKTTDKTLDKTIDKAIDKTKDKTIDKTIDKTLDKTIDKEDNRI